MLGNEAVARGLYEAGCSIASSYPGTPSTEITESFAEYSDVYAEWAPNEKVALETAFGASFAGVRAFCGMKHVGLNVAADPLFTISYTGVNAGLVIAVADDAGMHSSQNEQDSRNYAIAAKLPMLEPADSAECLEYAKYAFELSEQFDTPVLLRMCTRISHSRGAVETGERRVPPAAAYEKRAEKYVMMPGNARRRRPIVERRTRRLAELADDTFLNRVEPGGGDIGIIASGTAYQYAREVFGDGASILKIGLVNPLPEKLILDFAAGVKKLFVIEELDPVIENHCKRLGLNITGKSVFPAVDEFSPNLVAAAFGLGVPSGRTLGAQIPARPPVMCAGCPHRGLFYALSKNKITVIGDIGCYTLGASAPLAAMDSTVCMGASVSGVHGWNRATGRRDAPRAVAVIGDSTFMHSGVTGLVNIAYNGSNSTVIILDNSITGMTGHQQNPTTGYNIKGDPAGKIDLEALCRAVGIKRVSVVDPYNLESCERVLLEELDAEEPSVVISRRPCALLKYVKATPPLRVDPERCKKCKVCMKIGCPAVSMGGDGAGVDPTLCVGCGVCAQLCKFDAIVQTGEAAEA
jgi:indolepyruvate ferredoxin oxidoreductase alpha subunit